MTTDYAWCFNNPHEAAAEIDRLLAEIAAKDVRINQLKELRDDNQDLRDDSERLMRQVDWERDIANGYRKAGNELCAEKDAQIERLRKVLRLALSEAEHQSPFHAGDLEWVQQAKRCLSSEPGTQS